MCESIKYSVCERSNPIHPNEPVKAYATIQHQKTISLSELADRIVKHGSPFSCGSIQCILVDMTDCIAEALQEGNNVRLGDLGVIKTSIKSEGTLAGTDKDGNRKTATEMFSAANIKGLNVIFTQSKRLKDILSTATFDVTTTRAAQAAALRAKRREQSEEEETTPEP